MYIHTLQIAEDYGGPRKEFCVQLIREVKIKYSDSGLTEHLEEENYLEVGFFLVSNILLLRYR